MSRPLHNYQREMLRRLEHRPLKPGTVTHVEVQHDSWCGFYLGDLCNCSPNIVESEPKHEDLEEY
jgi:hypothetical protein